MSAEEQPERFSITAFSEKSWFSWTVLVAAIALTTWITSIYEATKANAKADTAMLALVDRVNARLENLPSKSEVQLMVEGSVNKSLLGVYRELGEIKGRLQVLEKGSKEGN